MIYKFENLELDLVSGRGTLYKDNKILFRGDGYVAIKMMINESGNNARVLRFFHSQLSMREACRFEKTDKGLSNEVERQ